jgi:hypothetical protein
VTGWDWAIVAVGVAYLLVVAASFTAAGQEYFLAKMVRYFGSDIPVSPELEPTLRARATVRNRWPSIGGLSGLILGYGLIRLSGTPLAALSLCLAVVASMIGIGAALAAVCLVANSRMPESPVRLARTRSVSIGDYVSTPLRVVVWLMVAFAVGSVLVALWAGGVTSASSLPTVLTAVAGCASMAAFEIGGRAIVRRAAPVGSQEEMLWNDLQRVSDLRGLLEIPVMIIYLGSLATFFLLPDEAQASGAGGGFAVRVCIVVLYGVYMLSKRFTKNRYAYRLWISKHDGVVVGLPEAGANIL